MRVRKVRCPSCRAPKLKPSSSAYVYCDYCAQFMDWDFRGASAGVQPGPLYRALVHRLSSDLESARASGDAAALGESYRQIYGYLMTECPANYSPRIRDPAYRDAMLARSVHAQVIRELDPACKEADGAVSAAVRKLEYDNLGGGMNRVRGPSFWVMYEAIVRADAVVRAAVLAVPEPCPDPDATPPALSAIMRDSIVVQAWSPFLDEATVAELLERTGLREEYDEIDDPTMLPTPCRACGAARESPTGAGRVVCEQCGMIDELGRAGYCGMCGGPIRFGVGATSVTCVHCNAVIDAVTALGV